MVKLTDSAFGYGSGYGYGSSSGNGYGYGYGSGYSHGYGNGYDDGSGYGDGNDESDGYGKGYDDGSDYGSGYGDGNDESDGYGYGNGDQLANEIYFTAAMFAAAKQLPMRPKGVIALWKSTLTGTPANGGIANKNTAKPGLIEEVQGPLILCSSQALHATHDPSQWKGERLWLVSLHGEVVVARKMIGALKREILCEIVRSTPRQKRKRNNQ